MAFERNNKMLSDTLKETNTSVKETVSISKEANSGITLGKQKKKGLRRSHSFSLTDDRYEKLIKLKNKYDYTSVSEVLSDIIDQVNM